MQTAMLLPIVTISLFVKTYIFEHVTAVAWTSLQWLMNLGTLFSTKVRIWCYVGAHRRPQSLHNPSGKQILLQPSS